MLLSSAAFRRTPRTTLNAATIPLREIFPRPDSIAVSILFPRVCAVPNRHRRAKLRTKCFLNRMPFLAGRSAQPRALRGCTKLARLASQARGGLGPASGGGGLREKRGIHPLKGLAPWEICPSREVCWRLGDMPAACSPRVALGSDPGSPPAKMFAPPFLCSTTRSRGRGECR
jgi:hypothetical protein